MKAVRFIENNFWLLLVASLFLGVLFPVFNDFLMKLIVPELMLILFFVFLRTDLVALSNKIKDYKLMSYLLFMYLLVVPTLVYFSLLWWDTRFAICGFLLAAAPAGVATPVFTDILKGNTNLSLSMTILTSLVAPFTIPVLFWIFFQNEQIASPIAIFLEVAAIVFIPIIAAQFAIKFFPKVLNKTKPYFKATEMLLLFLLIYSVMGSQQSYIFNNPMAILTDLIFLYLLFIGLHLLGYLIGIRHNKEDKIAITLSKAYMNNALALVLAAQYFDPSILIVMVLSELPWNTLPIVFQRVTRSF